MDSIVIPRSLNGFTYLISFCLKSLHNLFLNYSGIVSDIKQYERWFVFLWFVSSLTSSDDFLTMEVVLACFLRISAYIDIRLMYWFKFRPFYYCRHQQNMAGWIIFYCKIIWLRLPNSKKTTQVWIRLKEDISINICIIFNTEITLYFGAVLCSFKEIYFLN